MNNTYHCLSCGRENPIRGASYLNKYCNNQCQQDHRRKLLTEKRITEWQSDCSLYVWKEVPKYIKDYLIQARGNKCQGCGITEWRNKSISLIAVQRDNDVYNNKENNLELLCPNCRTQK